MSSETLPSETPGQAVMAEAGLAYTFTYDLKPGPTPVSKPEVHLFGPASMTALVTSDSASITIDLLQEGFSSKVTFEFKPDDPLNWHDFCGGTLGQPSWVTELKVAETQVRFTVANPAGTTDPQGLTQPIIATFTPNIVGKLSGVQVEIPSPDPTIVNIDPTGG